MAENRVIGREGTLPWHLPADLRKFKALTTGHTIIMGRKTFDGIGKALPGRRTIVVTRNAAWKADGVETSRGLPNAIELAGGEAEIFVVGGAEIYRQALPLARRTYLTVVHAVVSGDAHFPSLPAAEWRLVESEPHPSDERHAFSFDFRRYERVETST